MAGIVLALAAAVAGGAEPIPLYGVMERSFVHAGEYDNAYHQVSATAELTPPDGRELRRAPLFWDGGRRWKLRFSPDATGSWRFSIRSNDSGLDGQRGQFEVAPSDLHGGIQPMSGHPHYFQHQNGQPFWFMGDTAWALYTDRVEEQHDRAAVEHYIAVRAAQGFNVVHSMLLSEAGWGNAGGPPFLDLGREEINPAYWGEVDARLAYLNAHDITGGLVLAWGSKRRREPYAWREFPSHEARVRYARYIVARYSAFNVYFIVAGEWHAELRTRAGTTDEEVRQEFISLGDAVRQADPHGRMIAIHPMTADGSVREFGKTTWMSFGDYQQNYRDLHARAVESRIGRGPVVNAEYGYYLRDRNGDGKCDKPNSATVDIMRHATWDIAMAGAHFVTGFGSTYFGGNRHPGPFSVDDPRNDVWERQVQHVRRLFADLEWWRLEPHDDWVTAAVPRSGDRRVLGVQAPPETTYWALAEPGRQCVVYVRGVTGEVRVRPDAELRRQGGKVRGFDVRTGEWLEMGRYKGGGDFTFTARAGSELVVVLTAGT